MLFTGGRNRQGGGLMALIAMIVAPIAASLVQMAISRTREYLADRRGAEICRDPQALASALQKIEHYAQGIRNPVAERSPASAQLFIINPLHGEKADALFSTHPRTQNRIQRLLAMVPELSGAQGKAGAVSSSTRGPWG